MGAPQARPKAKGKKMKKNGRAAGAPQGKRGENRAKWARRRRSPKENGEKRGGMARATGARRKVGKNEELRAPKARAKQKIGFYYKT